VIPFNTAMFSTVKKRRSFSADHSVDIIRNTFLSFLISIYLQACLVNVNYMIPEGYPACSWHVAILSTFVSPVKK
jgi:hypothetical protein